MNYLMKKLNTQRQLVYPRIIILLIITPMCTVVFLRFLVCNVNSTFSGKNVGPPMFNSFSNSCRISPDYNIHLFQFLRLRWNS